MFFQGLLISIGAYFSSMTDFIYSKIELYFGGKINDLFQSELNNDEYFYDKLMFTIKNELSDIGFKKEEIQPIINKIKNLITQSKQIIDEERKGPYTYQKEICQMLFELVFESIINYIIDERVAKIILALKIKEIIPIEICAQINDFKAHYFPNTIFYTNLKNFFLIKQNIVQKLISNKINIEKLQNITTLKDKLQLFYFIFRILDLFNLENYFDFSVLKKEIKENIDSWLLNVPLVSLKNPDLYYCGLYLADKLDVEIDHNKLISFLNLLTDNSIEEFDSLLIQGTRRLYYLLKSSDLLKVKLSLEKLYKQINKSNIFLKPGELKQYETSRIVIIYKICKILQKNYNFTVDNALIDPIINELEKRIGIEGFRQFQEGLVSAEASYYGFFLFYISNNLEKIKNSTLFLSLLKIIYRNLEIITFNENLNIDLLSELLYALESLKLMNSTDIPLYSTFIGQYIFPEAVIKLINPKRNINPESFKIRIYRVDKVTGELLT